MKCFTDNHKPVAHVQKNNFRMNSLFMSSFCIVILLPTQQGFFCTFDWRLNHSFLSVPVTHLILNMESMPYPPMTATPAVCVYVCVGGLVRRVILAVENNKTREFCSHGLLHNSTHRRKVHRARNTQIGSKDKHSRAKGNMNLSPSCTWGWVLVA